MTRHYTRRELLERGIRTGTALAATMAVWPLKVAAAPNPIDPAALKRLGRKLLPPRR